MTPVEQRLSPRLEAGRKRWLEYLIQSGLTNAAKDIARLSNEEYLELVVLPGREVVTPWGEVIPLPPGGAQ